MFSYIPRWHDEGWYPLTYFGGMTKDDIHLHAMVAWQRMISTYIPWWHDEVWYPLTYLGGMIKDGIHLHASVAWQELCSLLSPYPKHHKNFIHSLGAALYTHRVFLWLSSPPMSLFYWRGERTLTWTNLKPSCDFSLFCSFVFLFQKHFKNPISYPSPNPHLCCFKIVML